MRLTVPVLPDILVAVGKGAGALAVTLTVPELPDILVTVGESVGALAVTLAVPELPNILVAVGIDPGALAVRPTRIDHVGITGWKSALPIGWHGQTNEKEKHGTHRLSLTKSHTQMCGQTKKAGHIDWDLRSKL